MDYSKHDENAILLIDQGWTGKPCYMWREAREKSHSASLEQKSAFQREDGIRTQIGAFRGGASLDSIAVSLFGKMTVDTGEIIINTKEYQNKRSQ